MSVDNKKPGKRPLYVYSLIAVVVILIIAFQNHVVKAFVEYFL